METEKVKIREWIEKHKTLWMFILFVVGIGLGCLQGGVLNADFPQTFKMSMIYGLLLPIVEVSCGGSGIK